MLKVTWTYPVFASVEDLREVGEGVSRAKSKRAALPRAQAFAEVASDDNRPLLVLRECTSCEGTDDALLSKRFDNEKTMLYARWFRMVKLPTHVTEESHPYRNLFSRDPLPHLFLALPDGSLVVDLDGAQSQSELWDAMDEVLEEAYVNDASRALQKSFKLLDQLDRLDNKEQDLVLDLDNALEKGKKTRIKSLRKKLASARSERDDVMKDLEGLTDLGAAATH